MPISIHQLAVALPFTLVSSLGIGLMVQNYGFETTDLIAAQPAGTPAQLNAVQGPEEPVEQRRDASGQPSGLKELLNRTAPPAAQPGISDLAAPSAPAAAVPAPPPRLTERTNPSSNPSTNPSSKPSIKPSNKPRTNPAAARVGKPKTVNLSPLVVPACVPTRTDGRSKSKPDLPVGVAATPGVPNLGIPRGRSVAAKPTIADPAGAKPTIGDPAGANPKIGDPAGAKPATGDPGRAKPTIGDPAGAKPKIGDPAGAKPGALPAGVKPGDLQPGVKPGERPAAIKPNPSKPTDAVPGDPKSTVRMPDGAAPNSALPAPAPRREIRAVPPGLVDRVGAAPGAGMPAKGSISSDGRIPDLGTVPNAVADPKSSKGVKPSDQAPTTDDSRPATDPSLPSAPAPSATDPSDAGATVPGAVDPSATDPERGSVEGVDVSGQLEGKPACVESMPLAGASRPGAGDSGRAPVPGRRN